MAGVVSTAQIRDYDPSVFRGLNDFHLARDCLERHRAPLAQLGDVICLHGLHRRVGVALLHKHFEIADNERVVREFVGDVSYIKPLAVDQLRSPLPYLWRAEIDGRRASYYPTEFCDYPADLQARAQYEFELLSEAHAFLIQFANTLNGFGLIDVFGLLSLRSRDGLPLQPGETLLETTDEERRFLTLRPAQRSDVENLETTQTLWTYTPSPTGVGAVIGGTDCSVHCAGHCFAHCAGHGPTVSRYHTQAHQLPKEANSL